MRARARAREPTLLQYEFLNIIRCLLVQGTEGEDYRNHYRIKKMCSRPRETGRLSDLHRIRGFS